MGMRNLYHGGGAWLPECQVNGDWGACYVNLLRKNETNDGKCIKKNTVEEVKKKGGQIHILRMEKDIQQKRKTNLIQYGI